MPENFTFKASNDLYTLILHDDSSLNDLFLELQEFMDHLKQDPKISQRYPLLVKTESRYLGKEELDYLYTIVEKDTNWRITDVQSTVLPLEKAKEWNRTVNTQVEIGNVESNQVIETKGDIVIVGDVLPGGMVRATGNIFHLGQLFGVLDAGLQGDKKAVIVGDFQNNAEIRIGKKSQLLSFSYQDLQEFIPKVYYMNDQGDLAVAPLSEITQIRPNIDIINNIYQ